MMTTTRSPSASLSRALCARRLIAVDAHPVVRHGIARVVAEQPDLAFVAEAGSRHEAQAAIARHAPELVVMALELQHDDGLELLTWIRHCHEKTRVLVLSGRSSLTCGERALRAGALGFIGKEAEGDALLHAMREVLAGRLYAPPELTEHVMSKVSGRHTAPSDAPMDVLSDRELQIFEHMGLGRNTREIAVLLGRSVKTIASHRANIQVKLEAESLGELVRRAVLWVAQRHRSDGIRRASDQERGSRLAPGTLEPID